MVIRTCTGCRRTDEKRNMLRITRNEDRAVVDPGQTMPGRGAYVHHDAACMDLAIKRGGLARALRCAVPASLLAEVEKDS